MNIEEIEKRWGCYSHSSSAWVHHQQDIRWLIQRVKELEEGIRRHKSIKEEYSVYHNNPDWADESIYKLIE